MLEEWNALKSCLYDDIDINWSEWDIETLKWNKILLSLKKYKFIIIYSIVFIFFKFGMRE